MSDPARLGLIPSPRKLRDAASRYVAHGWPIAPLAATRGDQCQCGNHCKASHLLGTHKSGIASVTEARRVWADHGWRIAVLTSTFDVVELPGHLGSTLHNKLKTRCPTATARPGRRWGLLIEPGPVRWHFYLQPGLLDPEKVTANGGRLHTGAGDWTPAPPSRTAETGRVGWIVPPAQAGWTPHTSPDAFNTAGLT